MKNPTTLRIIARVWGTMVAAYLLAIFGPKMFVNRGVGQMLMDACNWNDEPTGFFLTVMIGYALTWWKPLAGAFILGGACLLFWAFNPRNTAFMIGFLLPVIIAAVLYFVYALRQNTYRRWVSTGHFHS